jgi:hypothetical protein
MARVYVPLRYVPKALTRKDRKRQVQMLLKSRKMYLQNKYYTRKRVASYRNRPSKHVRNARRIYGVEHIAPTPELAKATGCSVEAMKQIVRKGEGAYFSSGSRPNQTAQSWGYARLASALTAGKSAAVDYRILEKGCDHKKKAFVLAQQSRRKYRDGRGKTQRVVIRGGGK